MTELMPGSQHANVSAAQPAPRAHTAAERGVKFAALRHTDFRRYFITAALAMTADSIEHVITYWVMFQVFKSPVLAGFAVISHWLPFLLMAVYCGALADRFDCRRLIQISQGMFMAVSLAWGVLLFTGTLQMWHAVVLLSVHGVAGTLWMPAGQLIIHEIVGSEHLQSAVRMNATSIQLGILLGPLVGGAFLLLLGPVVGLLVNVLIYLPLVIWLQTAPYTGHREEVSEGPKPKRVGLLDAFKFFGTIAENRAIVSMVALTGAASFFVGNAFQAQLPEFAAHLSTDKSGVAYSVLLAANAIGAVMGGVWLELRGMLRPRPRTAIICAIVWALIMCAFSITTSYLLAVGLLVMAGIFNLTFYSTALTIVQLSAPASMRGSVIGLYNMSANGLRTFSGITVGILGGVIGIHWSLGLSAVALLAIVLALMVRYPSTDDLHALSPAQSSPP